MVTAGRPPSALRERWWLPPALCLATAAMHTAVLVLQSAPSTSQSTGAAVSAPQLALTAACGTWWLAAGVLGLVRRGRLGRAAVVALPGHAVALATMGLLSSSPGVAWAATMTLITLPTVTCLTSPPRLARLVLALAAVAVAVTSFDAVGGLAGPGFGVFAALCTLMTVLVPTVVVMRLRARLRSTAARALRQAVTDPLTGLLNRRGLDEGAAQEPLGTTGAGRLCVVVADVDHFKQVNDAFGHATGDEVLRALADLLRQHSRDDDLVVRHGGEEFAWVGRWPDAAAAAQAAERLRCAVAPAPMPHQRTLTVSLGVAAARDGDRCTDSAQALHRLIDRADTALYEAKRAGRNRVAVASDSDDPADDGAWGQAAPQPNPSARDSVTGAVTAGGGAP